MIPVTFQMVVKCHQQDCYLFERDYELPVAFVGLALVNIPGLPNVHGPVAGIDNTVLNVIYDGSTERVKLHLGSYPCPAFSIAEVTAELSAWRKVRQLPPHTSFSE